MLLKVGPNCLQTYFFTPVKLQNIRGYIERNYEVVRLFLWIVL